MTDILDRLERLERILGVEGGEGGEGRESQFGHEKSSPVPPFLQRPGHEFSDWMKGQHRPGQIHVALGVKTDRASWNTSVRRSASKPLKRGDLAGAAALCQALSGETRLAILNELMLGERSTAELMETAGIDRGQLYHHLRDLFVQGLVEQPERGRYAATSRGLVAFLVVTVLPAGGAPADRARALDLTEDGGQEAEKGD